MSGHRWSRVVVGAVMLLGAAAIGGGPASAGPEPPCVGSTCNGLNPVIVGCSGDAVTVNQRTYQDNAAGGTFGKMVVKLRYSATCNASWATVTSTAGGTAHVTWIQAYMGAGQKASTLNTRGQAGSVVSNMRAGSAVEACGLTNFNEGAVKVRRCTSAG